MVLIGSDLRSGSRALIGDKRRAVGNAGLTMTSRGSSKINPDPTNAPRAAMHGHRASRFLPISTIFTM
jgi:hypothetical protein